jgi:AraC-like DNA-binding protein
VKKGQQMPLLDAKDPFFPDRYAQPLVGLAAVLQQHRAELHQHQRGQLLWPQQGSLQLMAPQCQQTVTPDHLIWIPPQVPHGVWVRYHAAYRSVYIAPDLCQRLPAQLIRLSQNPLLMALLERISFDAEYLDWQQPTQQRLQAVLFDELTAAPTQPLALVRLPTDRRLAHLRDVEVLPTLQVLARHAGACEKTITRICQRELGLSYRDWRQQVHMATAQSQLLAGHTISDIAHNLGFSSDSAFATCFKRLIGQTPHQYRHRHRPPVSHETIPQHV